MIRFQFYKLNFEFLVGFTSAQTSRIIIFEMAVIANALIEAKTDQIDNLVLPIVTFCILSIC